MTQTTQRVSEETIYVTTQGAQIGVSNGHIEIRARNSTTEAEENTNTDTGIEVIGSYPIKHIETVNLFGGVNPTTPFLKQAGNNDITVNFFTLNGSYKGRFVPPGTTIAAVHRAQATLSRETELDMTKHLVKSKLRNGNVFMARKGIDYDVTSFLDRLSHVGTKNEVRGIEGEAAREYFSQITTAFRDGWTVERRSANPPEDHINSLLSLTYVMIGNEVEAAIRQANLNPYIGVLHADRHGRPSLALDLLEEVRHVFCDAFVARLVNRQTITHDDFTVENQLCDSAFDTYLEKFDGYLSERITHPVIEKTFTRRQCLRKQTLLYRKFVTGEVDSYPAMVFEK